MENQSLFNELIKTNSINFRNIKIGDAMSIVEQIEGQPEEIKEYSNPFYRYYFEIGEMEEITVYYNYEKDEKCVKEISLYLIHYPDHYWKKEGHSDTLEFWNLLHQNQLQPFSTVFTNTVTEVIAFFTKTLNQEPTQSSEYSVPFDAPHQNYKQYRWMHNEQYLFIQTYIDDSIDDNVKNTMILSLRPV
ncbi:MAG: hypothetical protein ACRCYO_02290 [Bacteroidia bacterium]